MTLRQATKFLGIIAVVALSVIATPAVAQSLSLDLGGGEGSATGRIVQIIALLTILSIAPSILVMVTAFTRIIVVLSFLRNAMGVQQTPPNSWDPRLPCVLSPGLLR